ncbi:MAG: L,D-transpeptidase [Myxococcales bacterium]|nr:L,D-transpeptidase [Myxococcales bacterium]MCB9577540.1 L,D-transpeptidase [Polyangiaceae bacterium]
MAIGQKSRVLGVGLALLALAACEGQTELFGEKAPGAVKLKPENGGAQVDGEDWSQVPVPPADGPKLAPIAMITPIYPKPDKKSDAIGYLRVGARIARSAEPVSKRDCPGGWYAVRPVGFVCVGPDATLKLDNPIAKAIQVEPNRSWPMPYRYAFMRSIAPNYLKIPSKAEQFQYEMRLERHLRNWKKLRERWDALDVGANDVPLDKDGYAIGKIPEHAQPMDQSERFGGDGHDEVPWWLKGERRIPNLSSFRAPPYAVIANRLKRHAGVALIGTFVAGPESQDRRFAITTDARLVPADKLKADSGSPFHGYSIRDEGLPVAFARKAGATWWDLKDGKLEHGERLGWREFIPLTGTVRAIQGVRMVEAKNGRWLRSSDLKTAAKPSKLPSWAKKGVKWIDISIVSQTMVLWEGERPVYATLVSTGRGGLGEPGKTLSTPRGTFRVYEKHVTTTMDSDVADHEFELRDVPWVMYFKGGYAIHGAYWHDDFGRVRSHGCVNVAPIDARFTFFWANPEVPEHWHAAYSSEALGQGTIVNIHP